ncbi:MAG: hypothetical protein CMM00_00810 [Rhodopirellula sp.]|nr:hypothetical protein [Rhodopirellula sp.]
MPIWNYRARYLDGGRFGDFEIQLIRPLGAQLNAIFRHPQILLLLIDSAQLLRSLKQVLRLLIRQRIRDLTLSCSRMRC